VESLAALVDSSCSARRGLSGKAALARYDGFDSWSEQEIAEIARSELFSLRRLDLVTLEPVVSARARHPALRQEMKN